MKTMKRKVVKEKDFLELISVPEAGIIHEKYRQEKTALPPDSKERVDRIIIPESCLKKRIQVLAKKISQDYIEEGINRINIVYILEGAFMFASDLERDIFRSRRLTIMSSASLKASTYGEEIKDTGELERKVKIIHMPEVTGKHVLLVEDIVDQGFTLSKIIEMLRDKKVKSLKVCVLLDKKLKNPSPQVKGIRSRLSFDYVGFQIPDRWVAGYGIDAGGDFRDLPFVITVNEKYYLKKSRPSRRRKR
jgi:hypoxanthine phosphoribosyltransferase